MPVYHFILHAYGSWLPDQPDGYHDRKHSGRLSPDDHLAGVYLRQMKQGQIEWTSAEQLFILNQCREYARVYDWGLHAVAVVPTHIHILMSWREFRSPTRIRGSIKQRLTVDLNSQSEARKVKWFARGAGTVQVRDWDHLIELVREYIPGHGPHVWIEERIRLKL